MAYEIAISGAAARDAAGLPVEARVLLSAVLRQLAEDPWTGQPYDPRWSPEFRTVAFGDGGLIACSARPGALIEPGHHCRF